MTPIALVWFFWFYLYSDNVLKSNNVFFFFKSTGFYLKIKVLLMFITGGSYTPYYRLVLFICILLSETYWNVFSCKIQNISTHRAILQRNGKQKTSEYLRTDLSGDRHLSTRIYMALLKMRSVMMMKMMMMKMMKLARRARWKTSMSIKIRGLWRYPILLVWSY